MPVCFEPRNIDGATDNGWPLLSSTNSASVWSQYVDGGCQTKLQPPGGSLLAPVACDDQIPKCFAKALRRLSDLCLLTLSPRKSNVSWASPGKAPKVKMRDLRISVIDIGSRKARLVPRFRRSSEFLAVGGMFMLIFGIYLHSKLCLLNLFRRTYASLVHLH